MQKVWLTRWMDVVLLVLLWDYIARFLMVRLRGDARGAGDRCATIPPIPPVIVLFANL